ncbi:hypothetical protein [Brevundimonas sp.]|uniref:HNH endonuclease n=1 Tax=Brevundimonas sp. TaxID=1871086 RepID=UPI00262A874A|nr:hypothetical protein [Brevundimonas sp.]
MTYQVVANDGSVMDAHLDIEGSEFVFHSRGGTRDKGTATNLDYGPAMRLLFGRLVDYGLSISGAWLETSRTVHLPRAERQMFGSDDRGTDPADWFTLITSRAQVFGRRQGAKPGGSRVKRVRIAVSGLGEGTDLVGVLGVRKTERRRLAGSRSTLDLDAIPAHEVWMAVQQMAASSGATPPSTRAFDLVTEDGRRLDPASVLNFAVHQTRGEELGEDVLGEFSENEIARRLAAFGHVLVPQGQAVSTDVLPVTAEDRERCEGEPKRVTHLRRERAAGLAKAKKSAFVREHGRLFCERCELDPIERFGGEVGEACIEVHHRRTFVSGMLNGHLTVLEDLQCLCANCHRIVHAELRFASS